jgi:hypothetical protein
MLEKALIMHCSPTLAGLKSANMVNYTFTDETALQEQLAHCRSMLESKGVSLRLLKTTDAKALIYVYRKDKIQQDLRRDNVLSFLSEYGYKTDQVDYCIERLTSRISSQIDFPHEIGLFLSYPLDDVKGFIKHKGQNCRCVGCWKVYCNECEARKIFAKFDKCKTVYCDLFCRGLRNLQQLTVTA